MTESNNNSYTPVGEDSLIAALAWQLEKVKADMAPFRAQEKTIIAGLHRLITAQGGKVEIAGYGRITAVEGEVEGNELEISPDC
jgi:hypothetical protein